jgi:pyridoxamine 5'-phosphate oxidase
MAIPACDDPIALFKQWLDEAARCKEIAEPTAMTLATADAAGVPSARVVLVKYVDERGFAFYTNLGSYKALQLSENPRAALCFYWMPLDRQVRVDGPVEPVSPEEADAYFASRPLESKIGAWASKQSQVLEGRLALEKRVAKYAARYALGGVPRPSFWSGYRVLPTTIEFWLKQPFRLHERRLYTRTDSGWSQTSLYP